MLLLSVAEEGRELDSRGSGARGSTVEGEVVAVRAGLSGGRTEGQDDDGFVERACTGS